MNPWDLFLLVSLTVIFQKPLKAILKTDQENKPWMKIQPTCQPQPWRAVWESSPHKKHGVFTQKAWGWGRDARIVIFMLRVKRKASCVCTGRFPAKWKRPHGRSLTQPQPWSLAIFPFGFFFSFCGLKESNDLWTNSPTSPNEIWWEFLNDFWNGMTHLAS